MEGIVNIIVWALVSYLSDRSNGDKGELTLLNLTDTTPNLERSDSLTAESEESEKLKGESFEHFIEKYHRNPFRRNDIEKNLDLSEEGLPEYS